MKRTAPIIGIAVAAVAALAVLAAGIGLVAVHQTQRDADGYYASGSTRLETPTAAFVSDRLDVDTDGAGRLLHGGRLGTIRVTATGSAAEPVFVGIARTAAVDEYLRGVARDEVQDFEIDPWSVTTVRHPGSRSAPAPRSRTFWSASASGPGRQALAWPVEDGNWSVVVMNADGSPGVVTDVAVGAKLPAVLGLGVTLIVLGGGVLAGGAFALLSARRHPRRASSPVPAAS